MRAWVAEITALFAWPAISSLLSFAALCATIYLATRSDRAARHKHSVLIRSAVHLFEAVAGSFRRVRQESESESPADRAENSLAVLAEVGAFEQLDEFNLTDFPSAECVESFLAAKTALKISRKVLQEIIDGSATISELDYKLAAAEENIEYLKSQASKYERFW